MTISYKTSSSVAIVELLLKAGANPDRLVTSGRHQCQPPLSLATKLCKTDIMALLLKYGGSPMQENIGLDNESSTPLTIAASLGHTKIVEIFLKLRANPNWVMIGSNYSKNMTPLTYAVKAGHAATVAKLLYYHANPNHMVDNPFIWYSTLNFAEYHKHHYIYHLLLNYGGKENLNYHYNTEFRKTRHKIIDIAQGIAWDRVQEQTKLRRTPEPIHDHYPWPSKLFKHIEKFYHHFPYIDFLPSPSERIQYKRASNRLLLLLLQTTTMWDDLPENEKQDLWDKLRKSPLSYKNILLSLGTLGNSKGFEIGRIFCHQKDVGLNHVAPRILKMNKTNTLLFSLGASMQLNRFKNTRSTELSRFAPSMSRS